MYNAHVFKGKIHEKLQCRNNDHKHPGFIKFKTNKENQLDIKETWEDTETDHL